MVGQAEDKELAKTDAQDVAGLVVQLALAQLGDPMVEQAEVAQHAEHDGVEKAAIGGGQAIARGMAFDQPVGVNVALRPGPEDGDGGAAG